MKILKFVPFFVVVALCYLTGAFIFAELNSALWPIEGRVTVSLVGLAIAGAVQGFCFEMGYV